MRWLISLSAVAALVGGMSSGPAMAQHHHHHGSYWGGHYDYHPAHYDVHGNHLHYHPGHYDYHRGPHVSFGGQSYYQGGYGYGSSWLSPVVTQPFVSSQPVVAQQVITPPSTVIVNSAPAQAAAPSQLPEPKFGAYASVPRVAADLASFTNNLCLTMHKRFQNQPGFNATYRVAYSVLQQAQSIRDMSGNGAYREEITKRLPRIDEDMHRVVAEISPWVGDQSASPADAIALLKQDVAQVGGALHYLMVDVGVAHKDQDPVVAARPISPAPPADPLPPTPAEDRTLLKPVPQREPDAPGPALKANPSSAEPKFGAYAYVPKVSSDVAVLANRLCLTMHRGFRNRDDFDDAYAAAYDVLQQSQKIRDLARDPSNRQELTKRLEKLDDGMHRVFAEVGEWITDPKESSNKEIENLKREFGTLGNAVHYLMTDVGVQHHDDEGEEPAAPPPKPKAKLSLPAPPSPGVAP